MAPQTVTQTRRADNPWILRTDIPIGISAAHIAQRRADLQQHAADTGRPLPMPAEWIIGLELRGFVIDLDTGERTAPATFSPTSAGLAAANPWTVNGGAK